MSCISLATTVGVPKKDFLGACDNWDYLVGEVARLHCRHMGNVNFTIPDAWSANLNINGVGFNVSHGDDVRSNGSIPWYGMVRRQKGLIALGAAAGGQRCRYFVVGHHHRPARWLMWMENYWLMGRGSARMPMPTTHYPATASRPSGFTGSIRSTA